RLLHGLLGVRLDIGGRHFGRILLFLSNVAFLGHRVEVLLGLACEDSLDRRVLGLLRAAFSGHVPLVVASATDDLGADWAINPLVSFLAAEVTDVVRAFVT